MTNELYRADEIAEALADDLLEAPEPDEAPPVGGVSIDSRSLAPGDLFVALPGSDPRYRGAGGGSHHGHEFVAAAARAGAAAAIVAEPQAVALPQYVVPDAFDALWQLARYARGRLPDATPVIAITGSSGKTTARSMLAAALRAAGLEIHASEGSLNNHLGVPLSLARTPRHVDCAVFEIGTNSPGEIAPLSRLVAPDVSLLLNVLPVHLEGLGDLAGVRREKLSIAAGLPGTGTLVLLDTVAPPQAYAHHLLTFGRSETADVRLDDARPDACTIDLPGGRRVTPGRLADGPHRRMTACAVVSVLHATGLLEAQGFDADRALGGIADDTPPAGRGRRGLHGGVTLVDDAYNANPESMRQALRGLAEETGAPRVALLYDMLELGPSERALHEALRDACEGVDRIVCVGPRMRVLHDALAPAQRGGWYEDCEALPLRRIAGDLPAGAVVLLKGSNRGFWQHGTLDALASLLDERG